MQRLFSRLLIAGSPNAGLNSRQFYRSTFARKQENLGKNLVNFTHSFFQTALRFDKRPLPLYNTIRNAERWPPTGGIA